MSSYRNSPPILLLQHDRDPLHAMKGPRFQVLTQWKNEVLNQRSSSFARASSTARGGCSNIRALMKAASSAALCSWSTGITLSACACSSSDSYCKAQNCQWFEDLNICIPLAGRGTDPAPGMRLSTLHGACLITLRLKQNWNPRRLSGNVGE